MSDSMPTNCSTRSAGVTHGALHDGSTPLARCDITLHIYWEQDTGDRYATVVYMVCLTPARSHEHK